MMDERDQRKLTAFIVLLTLLVTAAVALYALFLLLVGVPGTVVYEVPITTVPEPGIRGSMQFSPAPQALVAILAAGAILVGLLTRKMIIAWIGLLILFVFSILFLFGVGGGLLPVAGLLMILLAIIQWNRSKTT